MSVIFSSLVGIGGNVLSFEASPYISNLLNKNIKANNCNNVKIYGAVYDDSLKTVMYPVPDFSKFGSYGSFGISIKDSYGYQLKTLTIDSLDIQQEISFMKIDAQGSDLFAMRGAVNTINKYKMPIIFEYENIFDDEFGIKFEDYNSFISQIGYEIKDIIKGSGLNYLIMPSKK
jgi:FkbM family methyltransferase